MTLAQELYLSALILVPTSADTCGGVEYPDEEFNSVRYNINGVANIITDRGNSPYVNDMSCMKIVF